MPRTVCSFLAIVTLAYCVAATPDHLRDNRVRFLRVEQAPYPAAGYRPQGEQFRLPERRPQQQQQPDAIYGPPEVPETTEELTTTTEMPTTTEPYVPSLKTSQQKNSQDASNAASEQEFDQEGVYYIYHPDGLLQKVVYATRAEDMGYSARLSYKDVEPIKEDIYTYDPRTLAFSKIQF